MQYFTFGDLVILKNSTSYLEKLIEQLHEFFIIDSFNRDHKVLYILKILDEKPVSNTYLDNHLCIFCSQE